MEVNKAENVMLHHDEIAARPAKTWFQSEAEKKKIKGTRVEYAMRGGGKELTNVYCTVIIGGTALCTRAALSKQAALAQGPKKSADDDDEASSDDAQSGGPIGRRRKKWLKMRELEKKARPQLPRAKRRAMKLGEGQGGTHSMILAASLSVSLSFFLSMRGN